MGSFDKEQYSRRSPGNTDTIESQQTYSSVSDSLQDYQHGHLADQVTGRYSSIPSQTSRSSQSQALVEPPSYYDATTNYRPQLHHTTPYSYSLSQSNSEPRRESDFALQHSMSIPSPLTENTSSQIFKPIAIPATTTALDSAFLRAFPPSLTAFHISRSIFLTFLDNLNRIAIASPPLQALSLAGNIVGFVPEPTSQLVGTVLSTASDVGAGVISKGRTELALRDANRTIFGPRGFKVEIAKTEVIAKLAGWQVFNEEGKIKRGTALLPPIEGDDLVSAQQRRLDALDGHIAELDIEELPELTVPDNPISKLSAKASERSRRKGEERLLRKRREVRDEYLEERKGMEKEFKEELERIDSKLEKAKSKWEEKDDSKYEKEVYRREKERAKIVEEYEKEFARIEKDRTKEDEEEKNMRKLLWLLIRKIG